MRIFQIREDQFRKKAGYIDAVHKWGLPGVSPWVASALVANTDLAPTIVEAARAHAGLPMDGRSLLPFARNVVVNPLFAEGQPLGVLAVEYAPDSGPRIEKRVVNVISQFCSHASLALRNAWLMQQVQKMQQEKMAAQETAA